MSVFDIQGLKYVPMFLSAQEQEEVLKALEQHPWRSVSEVAKRRVQHYGYDFDYEVKGDLKPSAPIPQFLLDIGAKLVREQLMTVMPDQVIVNEYLPGQGIAPHWDARKLFGPEVVSISLGWAYEMDLIHGETKEVRPVLLEVGSAILLSGDARYVWKHGVKNRQSDNGIPRQRRVSLTFRTALNAEDNA